ncbi:MAG: PIN domain-containing protein [Candidatus Bathyarchaeia archaeon]
MRGTSRILTLDSNVFIAALKEDERFSDKCLEIVGRVPDHFILAEPSIIYQEVRGTLARKVGIDVADQARKFLDQIIHPRMLIDCSRDFCVSAYGLCAQYDIYAIDAMYLRVALDSHSILVSLDKEDFIDRLRGRGLPIEVYHVADFPY